MVDFGALVVSGALVAFGALDDGALVAFGALVDFGALDDGALVDFGALDEGDLEDFGALDDGALVDFGALDEGALVLNLLRTTCAFSDATRAISAKKRVSAATVFIVYILKVFEVCVQNLLDRNYELLWIDYASEDKLFLALSEENFAELKFSFSTQNYFCQK